MTRSTTVDYLSTGAGPAGPQLEYSLDRAGRNYLVVEGIERPGTFELKVPRHGRRISNSRVPNGYGGRGSQRRYDRKAPRSDNGGPAFARYTRECPPNTKLHATRPQDYAVWLGLRIRYATRMAGKSIERMNTNAGQMHQPDLWSDRLVVHGDRAEYNETLAVDYVGKSHVAEMDTWYAITMECVATIDDPSSVNREPDPTNAYNDFYPHPRIRYCRRGEQVAGHHLRGSLENARRSDKYPGRQPADPQQGVPRPAGRYAVSADPIHQAG